MSCATLNWPFRRPRGFTYCLPLSFQRVCRRQFYIPRVFIDNSTAGHAPRRNDAWRRFGGFKWSNIPCGTTKTCWCCWEGYFEFMIETQLLWGVLLPKLLFSTDISVPWKCACSRAPIFEPSLDLPSDDGRSARPEPFSGEVTSECI